MSVTQFGKLNVWGMLKGLINNKVALLPFAGAPTDGTSGTFVKFAGKGSLLFDYTNGQVYVNTGSITSVTWTKLADAVGDLPLTRGFMLRGNSSNLAVAFDANDSGKILVGDGTDVVSVAVSGDATLASTGALTVANSAVTGIKIADSILDGTKVANVANINVIGGIELVHRVTATNLTGNIDVILTNKTRIINVYCVGTAAGGAGDTITVNNGADAITNAIDMNVVDTTIVRVGTLDDAFWDIAAGGTLRISGASAVNAEVFAMGIRVA